MTPERFFSVVGRGVHPDQLFIQTEFGRFDNAWVVFCRQGDDVLCVTQHRDVGVCLAWIKRHRDLFGEV